MGTRFAIDAIFRAIDQITDPVTRMSRSVSRASSRMERSLGKVNGAIGKIRGGAGQVGRSVAAGALVAGVALSKVVSVGAEFEQTLVSAGAKFSDSIERTDEGFSKLAESALDVSGNTEFTASQAAGALKFMAKAGEDSATSMNQLRTFADLATVAEVDMATAADFASDAIGPLGLATDDLSKKSAAYTRTADLMAKTTNIANLGFEDLFESIKSGSSAFVDSGQDVEQFLATIAILAGKGGIKGSKGGKDVARAMARITDSSTKAQGALEDLGVEFQKAGKLRKFLDVMRDVKSAFKDISEVKRSQAISDLFGQNSKAAGLAILANIDNARTFEEEIASADGFVAEQAAKTRNTALGKIKTFWSTVESIVISVFFVIRDDVVKITEAVTQWAKANKEVFSESVTSGLAFMRDNFGLLVKFGPKIFKLVVAFTALAKVLTILQAIMSIIAATTAVTAGSVGLIAIAIVGVIAAGALLFLFWDDMIDGLNRGDVAWTAAAIAVGLVFSPLVVLAAAVIAVVETFTFLSDALGDLGPVVLGLMSPITGLVLIGGLLIDAWDPVKEFFADLWTSITDSFFTAISKITKGLDDFKKEFNDFTGTNTFDVSVAPSRIEEIVAPEPAANDAPRRRANVFLEPPTSAANELPVGVLSDERLNASFEAFSPEGQTSEPSTINTTSESITRAVTESIRNLKLDINIKDPGGAVESIEEPDGTEAIRVTSSGGI